MTTATVKTAATDAVRAAVDDLKDTASDRVDAAKDGAADSFEAAARAVRSAQDELPEGSPVDPMLDKGIEMLSHAASTIRQTDIETALAEARDFARRHPAVALGAAALAGFAAARFLKAGPAYRPHAMSDDPWSERRTWS